MHLEKHHIVSILGGTATLGASAPTGDMDQLIRTGFPVRAIERVINILNLSHSRFAETIGVPPRSWARIKKEDRLSPIQSDRVYRVARILAFATDVLEDEEAASKWLSREQVGIGGKVPLDLLQTEAGAREVEDLLGRIEHGVVS
jgi:putative toxin-antitoxin system antitoxin component (TIGR02293 family)